MSKRFKKTILLLLIGMLLQLCLVLSIKAQDYIGDNRETIKKETLKSNDLIEVVIDTTEYIGFYNHSKNFLCGYYFNQKDQCYQVVMFIEYSKMNQMITLLNDKYYHYKDYTWYNYTKIGIFQYVIEKREKNFVLIETYKGE